MRISHSASDLGQAECDATNAVLAANHVGYGPAARQLETALGDRTNRRHAFAVLSGSHALALAISALDLEPGSRIALPVLTCMSVRNAILNAGHEPVLVDIRDADLALDVDAIPRDVAAIVAPHAYGAAVNVAALAARGIPWVEDCATSPATFALGRPAGSHGTLAVFSFGATKYLTGGAGGMLLTNDDAIAERVRGMLTEAPRGPAFRHEPRGSQSGRMADLNAAVALVQLSRLDSLRERRQSIASRYLAALPHLTTLPFDENHAYYRVIVRVDGNAHRLAERLRDAGIDARSSVNPWLDESYGAPRGTFPIANRWRDHLLSLPVHPRLGDDDVDAVLAALAVEALVAHSTQAR